MKATELAKAFNEIDDAYLAELDTSEKERITMKNRKKFSRILIAAAVICLLSITAFAAEQARIHSFTSGNQEYQESYNALAQAMEDAGIPVREEYVAYGDFKSEKAYESTKYLLEQQDPPTAIFSSNNESTLGCLKYLTEKGMVPGREIALLGFDDIETLKVIDYRLSVVERDARQQGMEAMKLLMECFADSKNRQRGKRILVPYRVILRGSEKSTKEMSM